MALQVFLCFAGAYLLSYAFRAINAVIGPALQVDLGLSNADLGLLSAAYFLGFAALQLPLGIWLDRYGARRTESALLLFAAGGAAVFAMSHSLAGLWIGRAMIGAGVSACLMAPYKAYRQWLATERQSQLASRMLVAGTAGALTATVPVTMALPLVGWRGVFLIMAGLILLIAVAIFFLVKKAERIQKPVLAAPSSAARQQMAVSGQGAAPKAGYRQIYADSYFRRLAFMGMVNQGGFLALQTLWIGPWMETVLGMTKQQTAEILFVFNSCLLLGHLSVSWWAPRHVSFTGGPGLPVLRVIGIGVTAGILIQGAILLVSSPWAWLFWILLAFCATIIALTQTQVSVAFPLSVAGRANTAYNLLLFLGAFAIQWGIGLLTDIFKMQGASQADAMRAAFGVCLALQATSLAFFVVNRARAPCIATLA